MSIRLLPLVLLLLIAAIGAGCSEQEQPAVALDEDNLTVEEVYARFAEAITRPGSIYQVTIDMDYDAGSFTVEGTRRLWVDVERDLVREKGDWRVPSEDGTRENKWIFITRDGALYKHAEEPGEEIPDTKSEARTCHGGNAAVSAVLGCAGSTEESTKTAEMGEYEGRAAVVLVTTGISHGEDETITFTKKLYLAAGTLLPIAMESDEDWGVGGEYPVRQLWTYKNDYTSARSVPDDFFDPASIGYAEKDLDDTLDSDLGITVYWLGEQFEAGGGLPPLALRVADSGRYSTYRLSLMYGPADDEFANSIVWLQEWDATEWNSFNSPSFPPPVRGMPTPAPRITGGNYWDNPCCERKEITLPDGRATLIGCFLDQSAVIWPATPGGQPGCPDRPRDDFSAHVYSGSTVVVVDAPAAVTSESGRVESPYNSLEGIEAVARGLHPRE